MMIAHTLATVAMLVLTQVPNTPDNRVGVLVGLQRPGSDSPPSAGSLRTLWIPITLSSGTPAAEVLELPDLLIPRRTGFWRAGLLGTCSEKPAEIAGTPGTVAADVADYLWSAPVGARGQVRLEDQDERVGSCVTQKPYCANDSRTEVYWVWPEYASLDMSHRFECGVHPDFDGGFTVRSLDSLDKALSVTDVLGSRAEMPFQNAFEKGKRRYREEWSEPCEAGNFEIDSWYIKRAEGRWKTIGWNQAERVCGYGFDFEVDLDLSPLSGRKDDADRWQQLKQRMPEIVDAHFAPTGQWTLVATAQQLMVFAGSDFSKPVVTVPLSQSERLIMVEWAGGRNVARWTDTARMLQTTNRPQPLVHKPDK